MARAESQPPEGRLLFEPDDAESDAIVARALVQRCATSFCLASEVWLGACAVLTLPVVLLDLIVDGVDAWGPPLPTDEQHLWCEAIDAHRFVRTPVNSYSALAFAYFGLLILVLVYLFDAAPARNHFRVFALYNWLYAFAMVFAGVGSFLSHASAVGGWADALDGVSAWPLVAVPAFCFAMRLFLVPAQEHVYWVSFLLAVATAIGLALPHVLASSPDAPGVVAYQFYGAPSFGVLFVLLIVARLIGQACGTHPSSTTGPAALVLAVTLSAVGFGLHRPERLGVCDPNGVWFLNTHLWWHVLQAASAFLVWCWCYFEDVVDDAYLERARHARDARRPRLRLLPDLGRLLLNQPSRVRAV